MIKVVCISDTHESFPVVPDGDILIHAGDATFVGRIDKIIAFNKWLGTLPHKHKIFVAGNHDWLFEKSHDIAKALLSNATYLRDEWVVVEGLVIYGSPWQPEFCNWAFNVPRGRALARKWEMIPDKVDVLVTHGPPYGILDETPQKEKVGCEELLKRVFEVKPQLHVFGHIHNGYGMHCQDGITFVNASQMDERYLLINKPIVVEL